MRKMNDKQVNAVLCAGIGLAAGLLAGVVVSMGEKKLVHILKEMDNQGMTEEDMFEEEEMFEAEEMPDHEKMAESREDIFEEE